MDNYDKIYALLETFPTGYNYVFVEGNYFSFPEGENITDTINIDKKIAETEKDNLNSSPEIKTITTFKNNIFCGGGDFSHGSTGFVACLSKDLKINWLITHGLNPIHKIDFLENTFVAYSDNGNKITSPILLSEAQLKNIEIN